MKSIARSYFYWSINDKNIEDRCSRTHKPYQKNANNLHKSEVIRWNRPKKPLERIHIDFMGPIKGLYYFIIIIAYSKFQEIKIINKLKPKKRLENLEKH